MYLFETLDSLIVSLATAGLIFSGQFLLNWRNSKVPAGRVWGHFQKKRVEIVITTAPEHSMGEMTTLVFPAEAASASEVQTFISKSVKADCRINFSALFPASKYDRNLVVIGGPMHNQVTALLLREAAGNLGAKFDGHKIILDDGSVFEATFNDSSSGGKEFATDIGLVIHTLNPLDKDSFVTLLLGSRTYGCLTAARALLHEETKGFARHVKKMSQYGAIVSSKVVAGDVHALKVERVWEIS